MDPEHWEDGTLSADTKKRKGVRRAEAFLND
jgi:hypothetical protein